jgi:hypothetical protein
MPASQSPLLLQGMVADGACRTFQPRGRDVSEMPLALPKMWKFMAELRRAAGRQVDRCPVLWLLGAW